MMIQQMGLVMSQTLLLVLYGLGFLWVLERSRWFRSQFSTHRRPLRVLVFTGLCATALIPFGASSVLLSLRGLLGDLSVASALLIGSAFWHRVCVPEALKTERARLFSASLSLDFDKRRSVRAGSYFQVLLVFLAVIFYPMSLGFGSFDVYNLGFAPVSIVSLQSFLLLAMGAAWCVRADVLVWWFGFALLLYLGAVFESHNLWDYLFDPFACLWALMTGLVAVGRRVLKNQPIF